MEARGTDWLGFGGGGGCCEAGVGVEGEGGAGGGVVGFGMDEAGLGVDFSEADATDVRIGEAVELGVSIGLDSGFGTTLEGATGLGTCGSTFGDEGRADVAGFDGWEAAGADGLGSMAGLTCADDVDVETDVSFATVVASDGEETTFGADFTAAFSVPVFSTSSKILLVVFCGTSGTFSSFTALLTLFFTGAVFGVFFAPDFAVSSLSATFFAVLVFFAAAVVVVVFAVAFFPSTASPAPGSSTTTFLGRPRFLGAGCGCSTGAAVVLMAID